MPEVTEMKDTQAAPAWEADQSVPAAPPPKVKRSAGKGRKKLIKRLIALGVAAAIFGGGGFALYRFLNATDEEVGEIFPAQAAIGTIQSKASGQGTAKAKESAAITLTQGGVVQEVYVTGGQTVMAGDPLYTIFSQAAEDAVQSAQEGVIEAQKAVTAAERSVTAAQEEAAKLNQELGELYDSMSDLTVTAPFDGKIIKHESFTIGKEAAPGPVCTVVNDRVLKLSLYFSYAYEDSIRVGQTAQVSIPNLMQVRTGKVDKINKVEFISTEGGTFFEVVITLDNPGTLTEGMAAAATMAAPDGSAIYPYSDGKLEFSERWVAELKVNGPVVSMLLNDYTPVKAGQALLTVGPREIDEKIQTKNEEIHRKEEEIASLREEVETRIQAVAEAQQKVEEAQQALADFNAVAPIDGTIISCNLTPGQEVKSGDTVIMISNNVTMLVTITVDDKNISFIKPGSFVDLSWNGMVYQGEVTSIDMAGAESGQGMTRYPVTLTVDNWDGSLMEGAYLQYSFVTSQSDDCVVVPNACVQFFPDLDGNRCSVVFVQRDEPPEHIPELDYPTFEPGRRRDFPTQEEGYYPVIVETGLSDLQNTEIKSGIEAGDTVFLNYTVTDYAGW